MSALRRPFREAPSPFSLEVPGVWRADALGSGQSQVQPTGHPLLDAQLPGGGWPVGALCEVLQPLAGLHEWQLILPALAQATVQRAGSLVLIAPPCEPFGPALQAQGLVTQRICLVRSQGAGPALWAAEQALRCRDVIAVMAWLPQVQPAALRRLQLAAAQQQQLLWVFRPLSAAPQASPALLRLQVQAMTSGRVEHQEKSQGIGQHMAMSLGASASISASASTAMQVQILKRRGPPLMQGLDLPGCHPRLAQMLAAQAQRRRAAQEGVQGHPQGAIPTVAQTPAVARDRAQFAVQNKVNTLRGQAPLWAAASVATHREEREHALDRIATAAVRW